MRRGAAVISAAVLLVTAVTCALWAQSRRRALDVAQARVVQRQRDRDQLQAQLGDLVRLPRDRIIAERERRLLDERLREHPSAKAFLDRLPLPEATTILDLEVRR